MFGQEVLRVKELGLKLETVISGILERHGPLISIYLSKNVSTSTDGTGSQEALTTWQNILYDKLSEIFKVPKPTSLEGPRYAELERLMLGLIFAHAVYDYDDWGQNFISGSLLNAQSIDYIKSMLPAKDSLSDGSTAEFSVQNSTVAGDSPSQSNTAGSEAIYPLYNIEVHFIFSDITKAENVVAKLKAHYLAMQDSNDSYDSLSLTDHDIAFGFLMGLDSAAIKDIVGVELSDEVISDLKQHQFPLHLGHASQAECDYSKLHVCRLGLGHGDDEGKESLLKRVFLIQYLDIAGARAHKTGELFLSNSIFSSYNGLHKCLIELLNSKNYEEKEARRLYFQYLCAPIYEVLSQTGTDELNLLVTRLEAQPSHFRYFVMFAWQFRLLQEENRIENLCTLAWACIEEFPTRYSLSFWPAHPTPETLQVILNEMKDRETPTYVPSVYQTLRVKVWPEITKEDSPDREFFMRNFSNAIGFTLKVGLQLIAKGIECHREFASSSSDPCCFNDVNGQLQENPELVGVFLELAKRFDQRKKIVSLNMSDSGKLRLTTKADLPEDVLDESFQTAQVNGDESPVLKP
ncbi:MAG: hypothetical protein VX737_03360 [Pseudomonadota bacterium]|nr:hypothetical protein [Pseudomonadota bacterium]